MPIEILTVSDNFTRPADTTTYATGDLIANSTTAGSVVPLQWNLGSDGFEIVGARIQKSGTSTTNADINLHLYGSSPTPANGDNGAWSTDVADYLGQVTLGQMIGFTDGAVVRVELADNNQIHHRTSSGVVYGLLEIQGAYAPSNSEVFTVELELFKY